MLKKPCYICGKEVTVGVHYNGLDRYYNNEGYTINNIRPCCGHCNRIKGKQSYENMMNRLKKIYSRKQRILCTIKIIQDNIKWYELCQIDKDTKITKYKKRLDDIILYYSKSRNDRDNRFMVSFNRVKMTKEEKKQRKSEQKAKSDTKMKEQYGENKFLKIRTLRNTLSRYRQQIKNLENNSDEKTKKRVTKVSYKIKKRENELDILLNSA